MKKMTEIAIILVLVVFFTALSDAVGGSMYSRGEFWTGVQRYTAGDDIAGRYVLRGIPDCDDPAVRQTAGDLLGFPDRRRSVFTAVSRMTKK